MTNYRAVTAAVLDLDTIGVKLAGMATVYTYLVTRSQFENLEVGTKVIVPTTSSAGYTVGEVVELHDDPKYDIDSSFQYTPIVGVIDTTEHDAIMADIVATQSSIMTYRRRMAKATAIQALVGEGFQLPEGVIKRAQADANLMSTYTPGG